MPKRLQLMTPSGVQTWTVAPKRMRGDHGQTHFRTKRVEIDDSFPPAVVVDTVIHEAWHVATGCDGEHRTSNGSLTTQRGCSWRWGWLTRRTNSGQSKAIAA